MTTSDQCDWPEATIAQLKTLWADGYSTPEIGRRLGLTKNAVVGKAHRLGLPARPSPIKRDGRPKRPNTAAKITISVASVEDGVVDAPAPTPAIEPPAILALSVAVINCAPTPPRPVTMRAAPLCCCQWPSGTVGTPEFRFCGADVIGPGRPYCAEHTRRSRRDQMSPDEHAARIQHYGRHGKHQSVHKR
jgi:GcrA cell cycle regulator